MKAYIKKVVSALLAFVMIAAGIFVIRTDRVAAADEEYIVLSTDIPSAGADASSNAVMTDAGDGKYAYTFTAVIGETYTFKIADRALLQNDPNGNTVITDGKDGGASGGTPRDFSYTADSTSVTITYDSKVTDRAGVSVTGATNNRTYNYSGFKIDGDIGLTGTVWKYNTDGSENEWGYQSDMNKYRNEEGEIYKWQDTFRKVSAGTYNYLILGDGSMCNGYLYGTRDVNNGYGTVEVPYLGPNGTDVVIAINASDYSVSISFLQSATEEWQNTEAPTTEAPTTEAPTTEAPTTEAPTTEAPTTEAPTTEAPTTEAPTTEAPTTEEPTAAAGTDTGDDVDSGDGIMRTMLGILAILAGAGILTSVFIKKKVTEE